MEPFFKVYNSYISSIRKRNEECNVVFKFKRRFKRVWIANTDGSNKRLQWEIHHILPKVNGGTNETSNLVPLMHDEHVIAHFLMNLAILENRGICKKRTTKYPIGYDQFCMISRHIPDILDLKIKACFRTSIDTGEIIGSLKDISKYVCILNGRDPFDEVELFSSAAKIVQASFKSSHRLRISKGHISLSLARDSDSRVSEVIPKNYDFLITKEE